MDEVRKILPKEVQEKQKVDKGRYKENMINWENKKGKIVIKMKKRRNEKRKKGVRKIEERKNKNKMKTRRKKEKNK